MDIRIEHGPGSAAARIGLAPRETFTAEAGAMIAMSGDISISTSTHSKGGGGVMRAMKRLVSGESVFLNHFTAGPGGGEVWLGATLSGDMMQYDLRGESLVVQGGSFVACEQTVDMDMSWQGFKTLLSGEHVFWLKLKGSGKAVLNSFGAIYPVKVNGSTIVDSGHIVAFNETLNFEITKAGKSWVSSILGGEGLVCKFKGQGTVWCQSHNAPGFGKLLGPMLKPR